jgi:hypothetical protein
MPFDLAHLMPHISALADYYADQVLPDRDARVKEATALLQQTRQDELRAAAQGQAPRVLAFPWEEPAEPVPLPAPVTAYRVLASDGSDIDPDPHQPVQYAVIHLAVAGLAYEPPDSWLEHVVRFRFRSEEMEITLPEAGETVPVDRLVLDTLRAYEEMAALWEGVQALDADPHGRPLLAMMDGIILWQHRGEKQETFGDRMLADSARLLAHFKRAGVPLVSFDITPHREVVRTLMALACPDPDQANCAACENPPAGCAVLQGLEDRDLFSFLPAQARSAVFQPMYRGKTSWRLPEEVRGDDPRLAFFYVHTGMQLARVELPLWVRDAGLLDAVHGIVVDQCRPLRTETAGYPVALTLAHNEAILTTGDRQAIQWMVEEALARRRVYLRPSAKAQMKQM